MAHTSTKPGFQRETSSPQDLPTPPRHPLGVRADHRELLHQILDKWSLSVLAELCERPLRFSELRRCIPDVTQKSLTATLRRLERNGIIQRIITQTRPLAVEYRITTLGKTLRTPIDHILEWADAHLPAIELNRELFDDETDTIHRFPEPSNSSIQQPGST